MNKATVNILVCVFWWMCALIDLGYIPKNRIAMS